MDCITMLKFIIVHVIIFILKYQALSNIFILTELFIPIFIKHLNFEYFFFFSIILNSIYLNVYARHYSTNSKKKKKKFEKMQ